MKLAKSVYLLTVALTLSATLVGCKKGLDKTTSIPGGRNAAIADSGPTQPRDIDRGGIIPPFNPGGNNPGGNNVTGVPGFDPTKGDAGIGQAKGDFTGWIENPDEFANQTVYFEFDKSNVKPSEVGKLEEVAKKMKDAFKGKALRIEGHCDERGTEEYNRALGDRRALSVREKLVQLGLDPEMLPTITYGEEKPADPGHDDAAWRKNRRGQLILLSPPGSN
ncbi:MAG: OmpA family protein [Verrucomicrobia bacterium]|nr:OmpA family protein [Verrucomicrobiota bacterium]